MKKLVSLLLALAMVMAIGIVSASAESDAPHIVIYMNNGAFSVATGSDKSMYTDMQNYILEKTGVVVDVIQPPSGSESEKLAVLLASGDQLDAWIGSWMDYAADGVIRKLNDYTDNEDYQKLEKIWADWEKFASYAFNKSHATCYSWVAYQTAFLKANYPAEYMAAVMSRSLANITDITKLMDECKAMGINTLGPDVNESNLKFTVNKEGNIRFGLGAVKGVGEGAVQSIMEEREKNGPFKGIFDFVQRVNLTACNKKNLECLALAGGFDSFPELKREQYFAVNSKNEVFLETLVRYGNRYQADQAAAANSLFGGENVVDIATPEIPVAERWSDLDRLNRERDLVGIYLSAHPLDEYSVVLEHVCNTHMAELEDKTALVGREITMGGIVTAVRRGISKNGNPYGIAKIEDYSGSAELPFFGNDWVTYQGYLGERTFLFIKARCQPKQWRQDELELKITSMELLPDVKEKLIEKITILIPLSVLNKALITELAELTKERPGSTELYFKVRDEDSKMTVDLISRPVKLSVGRELIAYLKERPDLEFRIN